MSIDIIAQGYQSIAYSIPELLNQSTHYLTSIYEPLQYLTNQIQEYAQSGSHLGTILQNDLPPDYVMSMVKLFVDVIKTGSVLSIPIIIGGRFIRIWHFRNNGGKTEYQIEDRVIRPGKSK